MALVPGSRKHVCSSASRLVLGNQFFDGAKCLSLALSGQSNRTRVCPLLDQSGQRSILAGDGLSAFDPTATLVVRCSNSFNAGFSPYQSARLNRYDAVS
jgi:hypothetical protein